MTKYLTIESKDITVKTSLKLLNLLDKKETQRIGKINKELEDWIRFFREEIEKSKAKRDAEQENHCRELIRNRQKEIEENTDSSITEITKKTKHKCPHCPKPKYLSTASSLTRHINEVHLRLKPYECDVCGDSFAQKATLTCCYFLPITCFMKYVSLQREA